MAERFTGFWEDWDSETVANVRTTVGPVDTVDLIARIAERDRRLYAVEALCRDAISLSEHLTGYVVGSRGRAKLMGRIDEIRDALNDEMNSADRPRP